jgi:hypothetical protein
VVQCAFHHALVFRRNFYFACCSSHTIHCVNQFVYVHVRIPWTAVRPPVPPVNPTKAVFPPTMLGMLMGRLVVNVFAAFVVSVIVIVKVVPSYVM